MCDDCVTETPSPLVLLVCVGGRRGEQVKGGGIGISLCFALSYEHFKVFKIF